MEAVNAYLSNTDDGSTLSVKSMKGIIRHLPSIELKPSDSRLVDELVRRCLRRWARLKMAACWVGSCSGACGATHTLPAQVRVLNADDDDLRPKEVSLQALSILSEKPQHLDLIQAGLASLAVGFERFFERTSGLESDTVSRNLHVFVLTLFYRLSGFNLSVLCSHIHTWCVFVLSHAGGCSLHTGRRPCRAHLHTSIGTLCAPVRVFRAIAATRHPYCGSQHIDAAHAAGHVFH